MESGTSIVNLPQEVIEYILQDKELTFKDVVNFQSTCKQLHNTMWTQNFWKTKMFQRWPKLLEGYPLPVNKQPDWPKEILRNCNVRSKLHLKLEKMPAKNFQRSNLATEDLFTDKLSWNQTSKLKLTIVRDELQRVVNEKRRDDLTTKFYANSMLHFLKQANWKWQWRQFEQLPKQKQTLEAVGTFFANWFQTGEDELKEECGTMLDVIADHVMEVLKNYNPSHPLFEVPEDLRNQWQDGNLTENQFDAKDSKEILTYLSLVLFDLREFLVETTRMPNAEAVNYLNGLVMFYVSVASNLQIDPQWLYINKALENQRGHWATLLIIYESVARRLGVRCEPVIIDDFVILRWKECYSNWDDKYDRIYIDMRHREFLSKDCILPKVSPDRLIEREGTPEPASTARQVMLKLASLSEKAKHEAIGDSKIEELSSLELSYFLNPKSTEVFGKFIKWCLENDSSVIKSLVKDGSSLKEEMNDNIKKLLDYSMKRKKKVPETQLKKRTKLMKFGVGFIVYHKSKKQFFVIIDWRIMNTSYVLYTLFDDKGNLLREVPERKLRLLKPKEVFDFKEDLDNPKNVFEENQKKLLNHCYLGRYFGKFRGICFEPNAEMASVFPEDTAVMEKFLKYYPRKIEEHKREQTDMCDRQYLVD